MSDAAATTVEATATETAAPVAPVVDDADLSNEELMAKYAPKEDADEAKAADAPVEAQEGAKDAPEAEAAPVVEEAKPAEPTALERAIEKAGAWREKQALRTAQAEREAEATRYKAEVAAAKAESDALKAQVDAFKTNPLEWLEKGGVSADIIAQKALLDGTAESKADRALREMQAKLEAFEAQSKQREEADKAAREAAEATAKEAHVNRLRQEFVQQAKDVSKYPTLARVAEKRGASLVREAEDILSAAFQKTGQHYTNAEILEYLEKDYASTFGPSTQTNGTAKSTTAQAASPETKPGTSAPETTAAGKPRTLTNSMAEKGTVAKLDLDSLSEREANERLAKMLLEGSLK